MILRKLFVTFLAFVAWGIQTNAGEIPRKEYPRPQFERKTWLNLNGIFDIEKKESIKTLILTLWKRDDEAPTRSEEVALSNAVSAYIERFQNPPLS